MHTVVAAAGCSLGSAYDQDPRLDAFPGCPGSKYVAVDGPGDDRVEAYQVNFPPGTTLHQTLDTQTSELPPDAVLVWQATLERCTLSQYRSSELAQLDPTNVPGGFIAIASETTPAGRRYLNFLPLDMHGQRQC